MQWFNGTQVIDDDILVKSNLVLSSTSSQTWPRPSQGDLLQGDAKDQAMQPDAYSKYVLPIREWPPSATTLRAKKLRTISAKSRRALRAYRYAQKLPSSKSDPVTPSTCIRSALATPSLSKTGVQRLSFSIFIKILPNKRAAETINLATSEDELFPGATEAVKQAVANKEPFPGVNEWSQSFSSQ